jgi:N-methylhydantoinase B
MSDPNDPVTFEIVRHKLTQVIEEAILALENVSGSPTTAEGHDMMVSLYRADGGLMVGGVGFLHHLSSAAQAVKHVVATYSADPGIGEGDVFMLNDSYTAALHPPDVYIISPVYHDGTLRGFVANFVHVNDIGAVDAGGFSPNSRHRFHEGFQTQGLKIVEGGRPRRDVIDTVLNQVREPDLFALDLRSQLAANHVAIERMTKLYSEYSPDTVDAVSERLIEQSGELMRRRLAELPDGTWRVRQYVDVPDRLHCVALAMTKEGETLHFDFTGTDPQSILGINNSYWATLGAVLAPVYPLLAWDLTWNEGMLEPISLTAPPNTLVNCARPGPVSVATVSMIKVANNLSSLLIGRMLDASPSYCRRASAVWDGMHSSVHLSGSQHGGEGFIVSITDPFAGSGGAQSTKDGVDIGGEIPNGVSRWANVETHELHNPVLFLYRRLLEDSGGPGRYRGGVSHEFALVPHKADGGEIGLVVTAKGLRVPMSHGISGGLPGSNAESCLFRDGNAGALPDGWELTEGRRDEAMWGSFTMTDRDILYQHYMGGGGYGDPLARPDLEVADDVARGVISPGAAREQYGVVLYGDGSADSEATGTMRHRMRSERLGHEAPSGSSTRADVERSERRVSEYLQVVDSGTQCTWCGGVVAPAGRHWKEGALMRSVSPTVGGRFRESVAGLVLRQWCCPECATLLATEVALESDPQLLDEIRDWPATRLAEPAVG